MRFTLRGLALGLCATAALAQREPANKPGSDMDRAIEEFKIQTRGLDQPARSADRNAPGPASKREWHGRLYEFFRNDSLDAVPHEVVQRGGDKSVLRRNQFGFSVSGPVVIPGVRLPGKGTFFTLTYEGVRESIARSILAERTGDYSAVVDQAGGILPIFDPETTRLNPGYDPAKPVGLSNLQYLRLPFPGNKIPAFGLDHVAQAALKYYPAPNASAGPFFRNNYFVNSPETNTPNGVIVKLDQSLKERHRVSLEMALSNGFAGPARIFPTAADSGPPDRHFENRRAVLQHIFTLSPNTIGTSGFQLTRDVVRSGNEEDVRGYAARIGLGGVSGPVFPLFSFPPYVSLGRQYPSNRNASNVFGWTQALSIRRGQHTLNLSGDYNVRQLNVLNPQYPAGLFRFSSGLTGQPGIVIGATMRRESPRVEKYDRQSNIDLRAINPANGLPGALVVAGTNRAGRAFRPVIAGVNPSASLLWNPLGDTRTVIVARYARGSGAQSIPVAQWGTQGFNAYPAYISPNVQLQPAMTLRSGLPPPPNPLPDLRPEAANNTYADLLAANDRLPIWQDIHLDLQRQLPGSMVVSSTLTLADGKNLPVDRMGADPNAISPAALRHRDLLNDEQFNRSLRPYPQYKGFVLAGAWPQGVTRTPLALRAQFNNTGGVVAALRPKVVPGIDPRVPDPGPSLWFNPAAFDQPPDFTIGDLSRTHPRLRNPGSQNWDAPDMVIGPRRAPNVNAGKIIGSRGGRVTQLGLRFNF